MESSAPVQPARETAFNVPMYIRRDADALPHIAHDENQQYRRLNESQQQQQQPEAENNDDEEVVCLRFNILQLFFVLVVFFHINNRPTKK